MTNLQIVRSMSHP